MQEATFTGVAVALGSGLAIGIQSTLFTLVGRSIGPVRASLVLNDWWNSSWDHCARDPWNRR